MTKFHLFGFSTQNDEETDPAVLGGKGAGLVWLSQQGISVPPGFVIPVPVWNLYDLDPQAAMAEIKDVLPEYREKLKYFFGYDPLVSVRSGSRVSCPGMMDTILNVGLDPNTTTDWVARLGKTCVEDSFIRLLSTYGKVVKGIPHHVNFAEPLEYGLNQYKQLSGEVFPDAETQLLTSIEAVLKSWDNPRAQEYRKLNNIPREYGTAVVVQAMVFGNLNNQSGTGVMFSRNPNTGDFTVTGEFLKQAQGEDIVAGGVTPRFFDSNSNFSDPELLPGLKEAVQIAVKLEKLKKEVQDIEFTIQDGKLYILQTRTAKRSGMAAVKIAVDMVLGGFLSEEEAVSRVSIRQFDQAQLVQLDPKFKGVKAKPAFTGIPACSGIVTGCPVFSKEEAVASKEPCILISSETTPDDIAGMAAAVGVITMIGGFTSHAGVVARGMNRACIVGVGKKVEDFKALETSVLSMDGGTGYIWVKEVPIIKPETNGILREFIRMAYSVMSAIPIVTSAPKEPVSEAIFYLGDQILHPEKAAQEVVNAAKMVDRLYLDLEVPSSMADFLGLFDAHNLVDRFFGQLIVLSSPDSFLSEKVLFLQDFSKFDYFQTVETVNSLKDLVLAKNTVQFGTLSSTDEAVKKVLEWREGKLKILSVGLLSSNPAMTSGLSVQQVLQLSAKE